MAKRTSLIALLKVIYRLSAISIEIPITFFTQLKNLGPKTRMEAPNITNSQTILGGGGSSARGITISDSNYNQVIVPKSI